VAPAWHGAFALLGDGPIQFDCWRIVWSFVDTSAVNALRPANLESLRDRSGTDPCKPPTTPEGNPLGSIQPPDTLLQVQQKLFSPESAAVAPKLAVFVNHSMTGNHDGDPVQAVGMTYRTL